MFSLNAKTRTGNVLSESGTTVRLENPQFLAECEGDRVPYVLPSPAGGYLVFVEYGDPCPPCDTKDSSANAGCGSGGGCGKPNCGNGCGCKTSCAAPERSNMEKQAYQRLLKYEIVKYSGFDSDGRTVMITERGAEKTVKYEWPAGSLVLQTMTGAELGDVLKQIADLENYLDSLGCILAVPNGVMDGACGSWKKGEWACFEGKWFRSEEDDNCTTAPGDKWFGGDDGLGFGLDDLLDLMNVCIPMIMRRSKCEVTPAGEWRCENGCWRRAERDTLLPFPDNLPDGTPAPGNADWSDCFGTKDLLSLLVLHPSLTFAPDGSLARAVHHWDGENNGRSISQDPPALDPVNGSWRLTYGAALNGTHPLRLNNTQIGDLVDNNDRSSWTAPFDGWYLIAHELVASHGRQPIASWSDTSEGMSPEVTRAATEAAPFVDITINGDRQGEFRILIDGNSVTWDALAAVGVDLSESGSVRSAVSKRGPLYLEKGDTLSYYFDGFVDGWVLGRYSFDITYMGIAPR